MAGEVSQRFFERVVEQAREAGLLDDEHFTVDGSLIGAWASRSSFEKKKDPPQRGSGARGRKMFRDTHESKSDPEARMYHKNRWTPGQPSYLGHVVTENKHGLIVQSCVTEAIKRAEREAGLMMMSKLVAPDGRATVAADTGYQERTFIEGLRALGVIPLVAEYKESKNWPNWLRPSEREHPLFARSQKRRRRIEKVFSWIKGVAGLHRTKFRGRRRWRVWREAEKKEERRGEGGPGARAQPHRRAEKRKKQRFSAPSKLVPFPKPVLIGIFPQPARARSPMRRDEAYRGMPKLDKRS